MILRRMNGYPATLASVIALAALAIAPSSASADDHSLTPDRGFSRDGRVVLPAFAAGRPQVVYQTATAADGSLVVLSAIAPRGVRKFPGYRSPNAITKGVRFAMASIRPNGSMRPMAGGRRWSPSRSIGKNSSLQSTAFDALGRGLLIFWDGDHRTDRHVIIRLNADGSLDRRFSGDGKLTIKWPDLGPSTQWNSPMAKISHRGEVVLVRTSQGVSSTQILVLNRDGSRDTEFGRGGSVLIDDAAVRDFELTEAGGIRLVTNDWTAGTGPVGTIHAFDRNGRRVMSFGVDGKVSSPIYIHNIALTVDGEILALWESRTDEYEYDLIVRLFDSSAKFWSDTQMVYHQPDPGDAGLPDDAGSGLRATDAGFLYWWYEGTESTGSSPSRLFYSRRALPEDTTIQSRTAEDLGMLFGDVEFAANGHRMYASGTIGSPLKRIVVKRFRT